MLIYQITQALLLFIVAIFITDSSASRVKYSPLPPFVPRLIQVLYLVTAIGYLFTLFNAESLIPEIDLPALALTILATLIIIKGVIDKKESSRQDGFSPQGLYRYMRHPIYTGVTLFILSVLLTVAVHAEFILGLIMALAVGAILTYLYASAQKEEEKLKDKFGHDFIVYQKTIYAVFPFKRLDRDSR